MKLTLPTRILLVLGPTLALGATLVWWSTRRPEPGQARHEKQLDDAAEQAAKSDPRASEVLRLMREKGMGRNARLVEMYAQLAKDKSATGIRALVMNGLFSEESRALRLKGVLEAVSADPTPVREDPLWSKIVHKLSEEWKPDVFDKGRDLMLAEQRPRAKSALIASFVELVETGQAVNLTPEQTNALLTDLIDMHGTAQADQRPAIQGAVRKIGGNDAADLLAGKRPEQLETYIQYQKELQAGADTLLKNQPSED
jgi:hypothetical protein